MGRHVRVNGIYIWVEIYYNLNSKQLDAMLPSGIVVGLTQVSIRSRLDDLVEQNRCSARLIIENDIP